MKFTDGKKIVDITIINTNTDRDMTAYLMNVGNMIYNEDIHAYMVRDVDHCVDFVNSEYLGAYFDVKIE